MFLAFVSFANLADASLGVTNITAVKTSATANNTYSDGWKWNFDLLVPNGETKLQMKFVDWTNGSLSIPAGGNMRFYSTQSTNASTTASAINIDTTNSYGDELILDPSKGQQVQVSVEVKVPVGTTGGSYSSSYGIQTTGTTTSELPVLNLRLNDNSRATGTPVYEGDLNRYDVFGIKPKENTAIWINELSFKINIKEGYSPRDVIGELPRTAVALGTPYEPLSNHGPVAEWVGDDTIVFRNLNTRLSQNWGDFTLLISPIATTSTITMSATLVAGSINADDNSGAVLDVSGIEDITSNEIVYAVTSGNIEISKSSSSPSTTNIIADQGINNDEVDKVTVLAVNLKANDGDTIISNILATTTLSVGDISTVYLYDGATELDSTSAVDGLVTFNSLGLSIASGTTKTLTLKVDIRNASSTPGNLNASLLANGIISNAESVVGSAVSDTFSVTKEGPVFALVGSPNIIKTAIGNEGSTTSVRVNFNISAQAYGDEVIFPKADSFMIRLYRNNNYVSTVGLIYYKPTSAQEQNNSYVVRDGDVATFNGSYEFITPSENFPSGSMIYADLESITTNYGTVNYISDTFRTPVVVIN